MKNFIPHCIQEYYLQGLYEGRFEALAMFVDVSGFTSLTQTLMQAGPEGAEILATILNGMFDLMVNAVYKRGGFIPMFAGDAFTAIFPLHQEGLPEDTVVLHGFACAEQIQAIFGRHGMQTTKFGQFALQAKVGLSQGEVQWGIAGKGQKLYFFRGDAIDGCALSEQHADQGEIVFDETVHHRITHVPRPSQSTWHIESEVVATGYYRLRQMRRTSGVQRLTLPKLPRRKRLRKAVVSQFFPEALINFTEMGEFRHVVSLFISFEGIATLAEFDEWAFVLLDTIATFSGYFNRMNFGDKGGFVLCGFGAPVTYENMMDRALACILTIKEAVKGVETLSGLKFRVGITYGIAYAGIAGGQKRCEYTYHGEVVNLAARFMLKAEWGEIVVSEAVCHKADHFNFAYKGAFAYKGMTEPVPTYVLLDRKAETATKAFTGMMVGRREELQHLHDFASPIFDHAFSGIAYIYGEAGIGKSRLAYALRETLASQHDLTWFTCPVDQTVRTSFNPFTTCLTRYFEQSPEQTAAENRARFEAKYHDLFEALAPAPQEGNYSNRGDWNNRLEVRSELVRTTSIIAAQVGVFWDDSLWEHLDAKGKYENTVAAIKNFFLAHSLVRPVVIELEDGQWLDPDSMALLQMLARNIPSYPILVVSTLRYYDDGTKPAFDLDEIPICEIDLNYFSAEDVKRYAEAELGGRLSDELYALFLEKTRGNPFFVQQLAHYFMENAVMSRHADGRWRLVAEPRTLPDTINAVLMARIDRLAERVKEVVKVAAVIGREFDVILVSAVLQQDVLPQIKLVEEGQIWEPVQELHYIFTHALLRDTAYEMQLRARVRELHRLTAEAMETLYAAHPAEKYAELAFHYEQAELSDKAREYLAKAGDEAKAKYQHYQALGLYDRLLAHLRGFQDLVGVEIDTLLKKGEILNLTGDWKACQQVCEDALHLAEQRGDSRRMGQARLLSGIIFRRTSQYDTAMASFKQALALFEAVNEYAGIGNVLRGMGLVSWQQGDYEAAMGCYEQALTICEDSGDTLGMARNANNIGIVYDLQGDYDTAMTWYHKSLQLSEELGEMLNRAMALNNIGENRRLQGDCETARTYYNQALHLEEALGDQLHSASTLSNVGLTYTAQGDYETAITHFDRAITILRELGNRYYLCECVIGKADALFFLQRYEEAQALNADGLQLAKEVDRKDYIFQSSVLSVKVDVALGNEEALQCLYELLEQTTDDTDIATLYYELWKITQQEDHRQTALTRYQALYAATGNLSHKLRIEEMRTTLLDPAPCLV